MDHKLKTWPPYYAAVKNGHKTFEVRLNDREFRGGDILFLEEWDPKTSKYTGEVTVKRVSYILYGGQFGIEPGYCVMGLSDTIK